MFLAAFSSRSWWAAHRAQVHSRSARGAARSTARTRCIPSTSVRTARRRRGSGRASPSRSGAVGATRRTARRGGCGRARPTAPRSSRTFPLPASPRLQSDVQQRSRPPPSATGLYTAHKAVTTEIGKQNSVLKSMTSCAIEKENRYYTSGASNYESAPIFLHNGEYDPAEFGRTRSRDPEPRDGVRAPAHRREERGANKASRTAGARRRTPSRGRSFTRARSPAPWRGDSHGCSVQTSPAAFQDTAFAVTCATGSPGSGCAAGPRRCAARSARELGPHLRRGDAGAHLDAPWPDGNGIR